LNFLHGKEQEVDIYHITSSSLTKDVREELFALDQIKEDGEVIVIYESKSVIGVFCAKYKDGMIDDCVKFPWITTDLANHSSKVTI
jgi:hypothetical protein